MTDTTTKTPAWFVCWECHCHEVRVNKADLPEACPGHGRGPIAAPELLACVPEYVDTHECGQQPCTAVAS